LSVEAYAYGVMLQGARVSAGLARRSPPPSPARAPTAAALMLTLCAGLPGAVQGRTRDSLYGAGQLRRVVPRRGEHVGEGEARTPRVAAWALEGEDVEGRGLIALTHELERVAFDKVPPPVCRVQRAARPRTRGGARGVGRARGDGAARR